MTSSAVGLRRHTTRSLGASAPVRLLTMATILVAIAACGADDGFDEPDLSGPTTTIDDGGPRVANARFDGDFVITDVGLAGGPVQLEAIASVNIETEFGALVLDPGCNTFYGSFSLGEDGSASFSLAGGTGDSCGGLEQQDRAVLQAFSEVSRWSEIEGGFRLEGSDGQTLTLSR